MDDELDKISEALKRFEERQDDLKYDRILDEMLMSLTRLIRHLDQRVRALEERS